MAEDLLNRISDDFKQYKIPTDKVGFYNHYNFIQREKENPQYLEAYALFTENQPYNSEYLERANVEIPFIVQLLVNELVRDGKQGACIDVSMILSKILEEEGYWNYISTGSLAIKFPTQTGIESKYFWHYDCTTPKAIPGHVWCVAPPFHVLDLTIKQQYYKGDEKKYLPEYIIEKEGSICDIRPEDIMCPEYRLEMLDRHIQDSDMITCIAPSPSFLRGFKPRIFHLDSQMDFKYIPCAINAPDSELSQITSLKLDNKYGYEIYSDIIKPSLQKLRSG